MGCDWFKSFIVEGITTIAIMFYYQGGNFTEEYALFFIMLSYYIFLKYFKNGNVNNFEVVLCGFSFSVVCLLRINMVILWCVMIISILIKLILNKELKRTLNYILYFTIGIAIIIIPILTWLVINNAFTLFIKDYFLFNFMYIQDGERASLMNKINSFYFWCRSLPISLTLLATGFLVFYKQRLTDFLCIIALFISLISMCISGQSYLHYALITVPFTTYSFSCLFSSLEINKNMRYLFFC